MNLASVITLDDMKTLAQEKTIRIVAMIIAGILLLFTAQYTLANERNTFKLNAKTLNVEILGDSKSNNIELKVLNMGGPTLSVSIVGQQGKTYFTETLRNVYKLDKVYELSKFDAGQYKLVVNNGKDEVASTVFVENYEHYYRHPLYGKNFNATFSSLNADSKQLSVLVKNTTKQGITLHIFDGNNNEVKQQALAGKTYFKEDLDLSALPAGAYVMAVRCGDNEFRKVVQL